MDIKALRTKHKLTQEQVAQRIGVSWITVSRWERRETKPSRLGLMALSRLKDELKKE